MSGHCIHWWRGRINNFIARCLDYALSSYIQVNAEWARSGATSYSTTANIRTRAVQSTDGETRERVCLTNRKIREGTFGTYPSNASYLSDTNTDNEGQHYNYSGEYQEPTGDGGHIRVGHTITGDIPEEVTEQVEKVTESALHLAKSLRETVEAVRAERLKWLLEERGRLRRGN